MTLITFPFGNNMNNILKGLPYWKYKHLEWLVHVLHNYYTNLQLRYIRIIFKELRATL